MRFSASVLASIFLAVIWIYLYRQAELEDCK